MAVVVSDFDKTLTSYDTITAFFIFSAKKNKRTFLLIFLPFFKILSKIKLISVKKEKEICIKLYCTSEYSEFCKLCYDYSQTICLNSIYDNIQNYPNDSLIIIQSASFEDYLKYAVKCNKLIATRLNVVNGRIIGINTHPYGNAKLEALIKEGITIIDDFYYDSKSDESVLPIVKNWYTIKNNKIVSSNNDDFNI